MSTLNAELFLALIPENKKSLGEKKLSWLTLINENILEEAEGFAWESQREMDWMAGKSCCSREVEVMHKENFPEFPENSKCRLKAADPTAIQAREIPASCQKGPGNYE